MDVQAAAVRIMRRAQWFLINLPIVVVDFEWARGYCRDSSMVYRVRMDCIWPRL